MNASAAIADSLLRQACPLPLGGQAGGFATQSVNVLITPCIRQSNGSPVRLPLGSKPGTHCSCGAMGATQRDCRAPVALRLQRVEREEPS